jgi:hypothetical protein
MSRCQEEMKNYFLEIASLFVHWNIQARIVAPTNDKTKQIMHLSTSSAALWMGIMSLANGIVKLNM